MSTEESLITENKKRKNRWGTPQTDAEVDSGTNVAINAMVANLSSSKTEEEGKKVRKSRWTITETEDEVNPSNPGLAKMVFPNIPGFPIQFAAVSSEVFQPPVISDEILQQGLVLKLQLQQVNEKLITVAMDAARIEQDPNRSPSPPPKYDSSGKRTNTREMRMRENLNSERIRLIEASMKLNPAFLPPADFIRSKPVRRIFIPKQTNPQNNYIGLIIGPRGNTQKQMEQETNCKISIRGKGSQKEGSKGRLNKNLDEDEELHCHITGDSEEDVARAAKMIEDLLRPPDDEINEHKQKQLRELALINGTLREDEFCPVCGERGHKQFECPHRSKTFKAAGVKCSICGDLSHPTRDCPMKQDGQKNEVVLDDEYDSFMAELGDNNGRGGGSALTSRPSQVDSSNTDTDKDSAPVIPPIRTTISSLGTKTTILAPIIDVVSKKQQQTVINVTTVMTGAVPPKFLSTIMPTMSAMNPITSVTTAPGVYGQQIPNPYPYSTTNTQNSWPAPPAAYQPNMIPPPNQFPSAPYINLSGTSMPFNPSVGYAQYPPPLGQVNPNITQPQASNQQQPNNSFNYVYPPN
eukprot:gene10169-13679_t